MPGSMINYEENLIPADLEKVSEIFQRIIPVCIISSRDFDFIYDRARLPTSFPVF